MLTGTNYQYTQIIRIHYERVSSIPWTFHRLLKAVGRVELWAESMTSDTTHVIGRIIIHTYRIIQHEVGQ